MSLYKFEYCNSDGPSAPDIFKANSTLEVAEHILKRIRKKDNQFIDPFTYGFEPYCCTEHKVRWTINNSSKQRKEIIKYLSSLSPSEFLDVLQSTHTHSGGDSHMYCIKKLPDIIDLTS